MFAAIWICKRPGICKFKFVPGIFKKLEKTLRRSEGLHQNHSWYLECQVKEGPSSKAILQAEANWRKFLSSQKRIKHGFWLGNLIDVHRLSTAPDGWFNLCVSEFVGWNDMDYCGPLNIPACIAWIGESCQTKSRELPRVNMCCEPTDGFV